MGYQVAWELAGGKAGMYLTSGEIRIFMSYFGVSHFRASKICEPGRYFTYDQACKLVEQHSNPNDMKAKLNRLMRATDWRESNERGFRGFIQWATFNQFLTDHGMTDE